MVVLTPPRGTLPAAAECWRVRAFSSVLAGRVRASRTSTLAGRPWARRKMATGFWSFVPGWFFACFCSHLALRGSLSGPISPPWLGCQVILLNQYRIPDKAESSERRPGKPGSWWAVPPLDPTTTVHRGLLLLRRLSRNGSARRTPEKKVGVLTHTAVILIISVSVADRGDGHYRDVRFFPRQSCHA